LITSRNKNYGGLQAVYIAVALSAFQPNRPALKNQKAQQSGVPSRLLSFLTFLLMQAQDISKLV
jgi:hypothetical protein